MAEEKRDAVFINMGGFSFVGALTLIFITLKLCGVIDWGWLWVLSPLWIGFGLSLLILSLMFVIFAAVATAIAIFHQKK